MDAQPGTPFGRYRLVQSLGHGGMAEVWRGFTIGDDGATTAVAVKRILPHLCDELPVVEMFLYEARLALSLAHPNVVRTLDVGVVAAQPYIAMELVDGIDLGRLNRGRAPLPIGFALATVRDLCRGLGYLHALSDGEGRPLGIIHRDVSHSNVMVQRDGTVKLLDFGVAKAALARGIARTRSGEIKGKLGYMAPEMLRPGRYDHRVDIFAAGVVLFELLTHRRLFEASEEGQLIWLNMRCEIPSPSQWNPDVTPALEAIVMKALAADPARRYRSAGDFERDLTRELVRTPWSTDASVALVKERIAEPSPPPRPAVEWPSASATRVTPPRARRLRPLVIATGGAAALAVMLLVGTMARPPIAEPTLAIGANAYGDGRLRPAAASGWDAPSAPDRLASAELEMAVTASAPATVAATAEPPASAPMASAPAPRNPPRADSTRHAHHGGNTHVASHKPAELNKVVGQTGLLDVYRH